MSLSIYERHKYVKLQDFIGESYALLLFVSLIVEPHARHLTVISPTLRFI